MQRWCRPLALVVAAALVALAACSDDGVSEVTGPVGSPAPPGAPAVETVAGTTPGRIVEGECPDNVPSLSRLTCGWLVVPQDREAQRTITVRIPFARLAPEGTADPGPPVVFLAGGPGESGLDLIPTFVDLAPAGAREVVLFDQRGAGASLPSLDCPEVAEATRATFATLDPVEQEAAAVADAFGACAARLDANVEGLDRSAYTTAATSADVADLVTGLGLDQVDLYGVSYGTAVAQMVTAEHPLIVRAVALDSVYPLSVPHGPVEIAANARMALDVLVERCADPQAVACNTVVPDMEALLASIVGRFDAEPYETSLTDPDTGEPFPVRLRGADVMAGIIRALYSTETIAVLPEALVALEAGSTSGIDAVAGPGIAGLARLSEGMAASVECTDRGRVADEADLAAVADDDPDLVTVAAIGELAMRCAAWGIEGSGPIGAPLDLDPANPVELYPVVQTFTGWFDPVTPQHYVGVIENSGEVHSALIYDGGHAVTLNNPCGAELLRAFLDGGPPLSPCTSERYPWYE